MNYLYIIAAGLAAAHAFTFGHWLIKNGNKAGAFFAYLVSATCLSLPIYRLIIAP